jgi:peptidyl-prolyl cis-trans isomerase SurA
MRTGVLMTRLVAVVLLTATLSMPALAQKVVAQIAAKVNKDIILASEVKRAEDDLRAEITETSKLKGAQLVQAIEERSKNVLRDLIDKNLILQQAADLGLDANIDVLKQIEQMRIQYNFPTEEALEAAMAKQGTSIEDVKDSIRYKNLRAQVIHREVTGKIVITTEEMRHYYEAHKQDFDRPPGVSIGMIAVSTEDLSPSEIEARQKTMGEALAALKRGEEFGDVAHKYSEDPSSQDGGVLPFFERASDGTYGLASPELEETVGKLSKGKFTDVLTNSQNHTLLILKLLEKHDGGILPFEIAETDILNQLMDERAEPKVRAYLTKLRAEGFVEVSPGFVDTGAATKPVRASETALPKD